MKTSLKILLFALILGISTAYAADGEIRISDPRLTTLTGIDCSTATTINIEYCHGLTSLAGLNAPLATTINIYDCRGLTSLAGLDAPAATTINIEHCDGLTSLAGLDAPLATTIDIGVCNGLTSLAGLNAPMATTIIIRWCDRLTSLVGLNAPAATTIITTNPLLQAEANEIVRQNLARIARWSGPRAAWCGAVGRITEARNGTRATAEATNTTGDEAGPAGAGSGACAHNGRRGL
jgi:pyruvate/2-oxoacid:ferredoxin oxidoreductase beta subunit